MIRRLTKLPLKSKTRLLIAKFSGLMGRDENQARTRINLLRTEMFVQDGFDIYELPIVINAAFDFKSIFGNTPDVNNTNLRTNSKEAPNLNQIKVPNTSPSHEKFIGDPSNSLKVFPSELEFLKILELNYLFREIDESVKTENSTNLIGKVAVQNLRKIVDFERKNRRYKRFTAIYNRDKFVLHSINSVISCSDNGIIIDALQILLKDRFNSSNNLYKDMLTDEVLIRATDGNFKVDQLINIIKILYAYNDTTYREAIDYLWVGFVIKQEDISVNHLVSLFKLLKYLEKSKNRMQILLEKKLVEHYQRMSVAQVNDLLSSLGPNLQSSIALKCASKWANSNLANISKYDLMEFVENLTTSCYVDATLEKAIEKTLTTKNTKSNDYALMASLASYCSSVRLANRSILNRVVKYLEKHARSVPISPLMQIVSAFGALNFKLQNNKENVWKIIERKLDQEFTYLPADAILGTLLSCAYADKYFPKYMMRILTPEFLNQLDLCGDRETVESLRDQLYLLDIAMTVECADYKGPLLVRHNDDYQTSVDPKIDLALDGIASELANFASEEEAVSRYVILKELSNSQLYFMDAVIHKKSDAKSLAKFERSRNTHGMIALLILLPRHYCWNSSKLVGRQAMKVRHLRKFGFRVVLLDFQTLLALRERPKELKEYLSRSYKGTGETHKISAECSSPPRRSR